MNIFFGRLVYNCVIRVTKPENTMETYYFQISSVMKLDWTRVPAIKAQFEHRADACDLARNLADSNGFEVRMTDNEKLLQGSYFSPKEELV